MYGAQGVHLNPLGLCRCTSAPRIWSMLSACLRSWTPWLRGPASPRYHASRPDKEKAATLLQWISGEVNVICATIAFGKYLEFLLRWTGPE